MEIVKDLTPELAKQEDKDQFYHIEGEIRYLLATQDLETVRPYTYKKTGWGSIQRVEARHDGTPQTLTSPKRTTRRRTGEEEIKEGRCFSFRTTNGEVYIPWGGPFGVFKQGLRRTLDAKNKMRYENAKLDLIKVYPQYIRTPAPLDSQTKGHEPKVVLTTRHTQKGDVMVEEFFDYLKDRPIDFYVEVDSECPINFEKLVGQVKSLNTLDNFGPAKRGSVHIERIQQVRLSGEELRKLEKA